MIQTTEILTLRIRVTGAKNKDEMRKELHKKLSLFCKQIEHGSVSGGGKNSSKQEIDWEGSFKIESI